MSVTEPAVNLSRNDSVHKLLVENLENETNIQEGSKRNILPTVIQPAGPNTGIKTMHRGVGNVTGTCSMAKSDSLF